MKKQLAMAITAALSSAAVLAAPQPGKLSLQVTKPEVLSIKQMAKPTERTKTIQQTQRFIVQLNSPAVAAYRGGIDGISATARQSDEQKLDLAQPAVAQYRDYLAKEQRQFASTLAQRLPGTKIENQYSTLFNGVSVAGSGLTMAQLAAMPNVKAVYPERIYTAQMDASLDLIEVPEVWNTISSRATAGAGIKVAVIDSGIRPENAMFDDAGFTAPESKPTDDYCATVDPEFCNNKLIAARYYEPTFEVVEAEHMSPLGHNGHGTHVAGTAVGNIVDITYEGVPVTISGVAPGAYLMAYKALFATPADPTSSSGSNIMLMSALEDAVTDGADVINNSWGGGAGLDPAFSPYAEAFQTAEDAGVVVVSSAGNSGPSARTIGCPACIESGIAVANTTHGRFFANEVSMGSLSRILAIEGTSSARLEMDLTGPLVSSADVSTDNVEGCAPFNADVFAGSVALISRGSCAFADKAANAEAAGAVGVVVYNNRSGSPITMAGLEASAVPSVMVSQNDGIALMGELGTNNDITVAAEASRLLNSEFADNTADSSSRGPNGNPNILKPDIAAPGTNILSASSPEWFGGDYVAISGTSMAAPHVAGAAALMRELHPEWSAVEIKTALTSTSNRLGLTKEDAATPADPFDVGAGRLNVASAAAANLTFDKASFADASCILGCSFMVNVTNRGEETGTWSVAATLETADVTVSPEEVELDAGASTEITVTIDPTYAVKGGWLFGQLRLNGSTAPHLPLAIYHDSASDEALLSAFGDAPTLEYGSQGTFHGVFTNGPFDGEVNVNVEVGEGLSMVADSGMVTVTDGTTSTETFDTDAGTGSWSGSLVVEQINIASIGDLGLVSFAAPDNQLLCTGCDEVFWVLDTPPFEYDGNTYSQLTVSDNGFVAAGQENPTGSFFNQFLPDETSPNNVIAPFWTDMDLFDGTEGDTGGGAVHAYYLGDDTGLFYLVVDWQNAQLWDDADGKQYSFQVILGVHSETQGEVYLNHLALDALPEFVTVGFENLNGTKGVMSYFDGTGTPPVSANALVPDYTNGGSADVAFDLTADTLDVVIDDEGETLEEEALLLDVLANDEGSTQAPIRVSASSGGTELEALHLVSVTGPKPTNLVITSEPLNGETMVNEDMTVSYSPAMDFFGTDSFSYQAQNDMGMVVGEGTVIITVTNVNDAPILAAIPPVTVRETLDVTLTATATDVDDDPLLFTWTQVSGPAVILPTAGTESNSLTFTAPAVDGDEELVFDVTVSDGEFTDTGSVTVTVDNRSGSSGSLGWLGLGLLALALGRRRS